MAERRALLPTPNSLVAGMLHLHIAAYLPLALVAYLPPDAGACRRVVHQRQLQIRSCAEPPLPPPKPTDEPEEKTYSDGWSGAGRFADEDPLPLSFWLLGPNPRRTLLPALLVPLFIGPATNLWGSGSLLLSLAPETARNQRLDTVSLTLTLNLTLTLTRG